jgi:hypothetical protein
MSQPVRKVLNLLIERGYVNWDVLSKKLHAALDTVDNGFRKIRNVSDLKEQSAFNLEDAISFHVKVEHCFYSYKLFKLRFRNGSLECSGFQSGRGKAPNVLWSGDKVEF